MLLKKLKLCLMLNLALWVGFLLPVNEKKVLADGPVYESIISPKMGLRQVCYGEGDNVMLDMITETFDNNIYCKFGNLPELLDDEKYFIVLSDIRKNEVIANKFLNESNNALGDYKEYSAENVLLPYYLDMVEVKLYKQKTSDPDFTIDEENLILKTYYFTASNLLFNRAGNKAYVKLYCDDETLVVTPLLMKLVPNYYLFALKGIWHGDYYEIIFPDKEDPSSEVKITTTGKYYTIDGTVGENVITSNCAYCNIYVPDGVDEFKVIVHYDSYGGGQKTYNCHVKLNK